MTAIAAFPAGLIAACIVYVAAAVLLDNRDLRRARRTATLAAHRAVVRSHDEHRGTAA